MRLSRCAALGLVLIALVITTCGLSIHGHARNHQHGVKHVDKKAARSAAVEMLPNSFQIEFINNIDSSNVHAYVVTNSRDSSQAVLITAGGEVYKPVAYSKGVATSIPKDANCGIPLGTRGSKLTISLPVDMLEGRVYVADGELDIGVLQAGDGSTLQMPAFQNPNDINFNLSFGFVEANKPARCIWANPTYVDYVGLPLAMELVIGDTTPNVSSIPSNGFEMICNKLKEEQAKDGYPWSELCLSDASGKPLRVLSPQHNPNGLGQYFDKYIDEVWSQLGSGGMTFNLQNGSPLKSCTFQSDSMTCEGTNKPFPKPTSADVWGCNSGPFANTADECYNKIGGRLCAAFHRATLLLPGGAIQPNQSIDMYYPLDFPHNKYARIVHEVQLDHNGYTFPYDDVKPNDWSEVSGTISGDDPSALRIYVGGRDFGGSSQGSSSADSSDEYSKSVQSASSASNFDSSQSSVASKASTTKSEPSSSRLSPNSPTSTSPSSSIFEPSPGSGPMKSDQPYQKTASNGGTSAPTAIPNKYGQQSEVTVVEIATVTEIVTQTTVCVVASASSPSIKGMY
ncbi:hypothetical protein Q7P37_006565 [Cladosporium fusiforme]